MLCKRSFFIKLFLFISSGLVSLHVFATGGGDGDAYEMTGSFSVTRENGGSSCTVYRPRDLSGKHSVIIWGNGTGTGPSSYSGLLNHWASWGFIVVAANTANAGTGRDMLSCLDWLERSTLSAFVNFENVGASGHSQGGGGSIMAGTDARISATAPIQGYTLGLGHNTSSHNRQKGPMLILSGSADTLVNPTLNHAPLFRNSNVATFWATSQGATHFNPVGDGGDFKGITTAWFMYQFANDSEAEKYFKGSNCVYCTDRNWTVQSKGF